MSTTMPATALRGTGASSGRAAGPVFLATEEAPAGSMAATDASSAIASVASRLETLAEASSTLKEGADILRAQAEMARDPSLAAAIEAELLGGKPLRQATKDAAERYAQRLEALEDTYLRERGADIREVGRLLSLEAAGMAGSRLAGLKSPSIVFAHELSPADTLGVDSKLLLGLVTEIGGRTSHAAIVARELGIPAVVSAAGACEAAAHYPAAEIDGDSGEVRLLEQVQRRTSTVARATIDVSAAPVRIMANVGSAAAAVAAAGRGAAGIGLFRTEFMFMAEHGPMPEDRSNRGLPHCL